MALSKNNTQTSVQSTTLIGLRCETSHINELHVDRLFDDNGVSVLDELKALRQELNELKESKLSIEQLADVVVEDVKDGMVLVWDAESKKWVSRELE